ncbi:phosphotransferase [Streptomyces sp. NPDC050619]|uniref:phosphotransferase family protein n=1 Tax=Streptomyces sp. NPDC050619 TaxID=3157214 RepID=UPI0034414533
MTYDIPEPVRAAFATTFRLAEPDGVLSVERVARPGRMSESARVRVREADGGTRTVFAKWPSRQARIRRIARLTGAYQREVMFYRDLAGQCGASVPRVHHAAHDSGTDEFVLLLEDHGEARPGDDGHGSVADVRRALTTIAGLHARWAGEGLDRLPWLPDWHGPQVRRYTRFELDRIARAVARGRLAHARPVLPLVAQLGENLDEFFALARASSRTVVHGDLHMDQVLLPEASGAVIVDWQLVQRGSAGLDVARLLAMGLPTEERRRHEAELLGAYREEAGGGVLLDEYRRGIVWTAFMNTSYALSSGPETFSNVLFGRVAAAAADHGLLA